MSVRTIHTALCDTLEAGNIGFVDRNRGRMLQLPWQRGELLPLWIVNFSRTSEVKRTNLSHTLARVYEINGFFPFDYEAESDTKWLDYLALFEALLLPNPAIELCSQTFPVVILVNDLVTYSEVLCQHVRCEFTVWEIV